MKASERIKLLLAGGHPSTEDWRRVNAIIIYLDEQQTEREAEQARREKWEKTMNDKIYDLADLIERLYSKEQHGK